MSKKSKTPAKSPVQKLPGEFVLPKQWDNMSIESAFQYAGHEQFAFNLPHFGGIVKNRDRYGKLFSFTLASPWSMSDGYGRVGTLTLLELLKKNYLIRPTQIGWINVHGFTPEIYEAIQDNLVTTKWALVHGIPNELDKVRTPYKVLWTMWEGLTVPNSWLPLIKKYGDIPIIVPSHGQIEIFRRSGLTNPIYVVPDCVDPNAFQWHHRSPIRPDIFTVVSWSHMSARKCPLEMVDTFIEAFPNNPNVRLILKTSGGKFGLMQGMIPEFSDKRITIVNELWTKEQLQQFLNDAHAGLFLSRGEGFFLEPLEATLTGLPCVVPTHSGCSDWAREDYFYPVRNEGDEESKLMGRDQRWWTMDFKHAAERLREIYDNYSEALARANRGAYWIRKNLNPTKTAETLVNTLDKIDKLHGGL